MTQHVCPTCKHWHDPEASMVAIPEAAAPLRAALERLLEDESRYNLTPYGRGWNDAIRTALSLPEREAK